MTTKEALALAVLRGDDAAAAALADEVISTVDRSEIQVLRVKKVDVPLARGREALFAESEDTEYDREYVEQVVRHWLRGSQVVLPLSGFTRMEVYELPPPPPTSVVLNRHGETLEVTDPQLVLDCMKFLQSRVIH